jgi:hypothetical protein
MARIVRKFDMQSFWGAMAVALVLLVPAMVILSKDHDDLKGWLLMIIAVVIVLLGLAGIIGHILIEIKDEERTEQTRPRPRLIPEKPYVNVRALLPYNDEGKLRRDIPTGSAQFVNMKWANRPVYLGVGADAPGVLADVYYYRKGESVALKSPGRWGCCKPQPAALGVGSPIEQGAVDFPANSKEHELDIAIRYEDGKCFIYNDYSQRAARDPRMELSDLTIVKVELRGTNSQAEYAFRLRNDPVKGFIVEDLPGPSPEPVPGTAACPPQSVP